jgi:hypothetical protein
MIVRLVLIVVGVILMIFPPYAIALLGLAPRLGMTTVAALELPLLIVGFVLLYLAFRRLEL